MIAAEMDFDVYSYGEWKERSLLVDIHIREAHSMFGALLMNTAFTVELSEEDCNAILSAVGKEELRLKIHGSSQEFVVLPNRIPNPMYPHLAGYVSVEPSPRMNIWLTKGEYKGLLDKLKEGAQQVYDRVYRKE